MANQNRSVALSAVTSGPPAHAVRIAPPGGERQGPILTRRRLQVALGCLWLLDGALQLQPFMFTLGFAHQVIAPAAAGQPAFVGGAVRWSASLIATHPALYDALFAAVQLALGLALLVERTARVAIVASVIWALGVWYFGEGLGGILGGGASVLNGAPGAVVLYAVLALASWPRSPLEHDTGPPPRWTIRFWTLLWIGFGVLNVLPLNDSTGALSASITTNIGMVPGPLARLDRLAASGIHVVGPLAVPLFVGVLISVGVGALARGRTGQVAVWAGCGLALLVWVLGQGLGQLTSGRATDPNAAPLVLVLGLAVLSVSRVGGLSRPPRAARTNGAGKSGDRLSLVSPGRPDRAGQGEAISA
jgi:hypothetical protein